MAKRLFGTDGVRGVAGIYPLDEETIERIGAALVRALPDGDAPPQLVIGRDTRESGPWIERALAVGISAAGGRLTSAGVIPTPAIAFLARSHGFDAGVVISASHNPYEDNGIKVFSGRGEKFSEELEARVEAAVSDRSWRVPGNVNVRLESRDFLDAYLAHVRPISGDTAPLAGLRMAIDCANGATTAAAPRLFRELGLDVVVTACSPDGRNINRDCGSTHPEALARTVVQEGARLGVAFDGDGDRAIFVDHRGEVVNGDAVLLMTAKHLKAQGRLRGNGVVATVMSNIGLELGLRAAGVDLVRCPVGDKYVMEEMARRELSLGGEQSGHIIFADYLFTGDGIITAQSVLRLLAETGRDLADLASELVTYPQVLVNVPVRQRRDLGETRGVQAVMGQVEAALGTRGRLLVRYSGTEPLLRIMIEGPDETEIRGWAEEIADAARVELG